MGDSNIEVSNFLNTIIEKDLSEGGKYYDKTIVTRFPPEPNGFLHIGHAKAICINFLMAEKFGGICNLRMDDTNPEKEEVSYVESIKEDVKWLGFDWKGKLCYASDYFPEMFEIARNLIKKNLAYVCELTSEQTKKYRGDLKVSAESPFRDRPIDESLSLFDKMKNNEFEDGKYTLRAKIKLDSGNFNMRDPVIYRIMHKIHHRSKDKWVIYPMYDFAHPIEDAIEGITHSLCSLEFEDHRPLYNWVIENAKIEEGKGLRKIISRPTQIEFARLNLDYTIMSKRKLGRLVKEGFVDGWDDPRMPTLSGMRRRGYMPESIRNFCSKIGISKAVGTIETSFLEVCIRYDLNKKALRLMAVLDPLELVINNYPEDKEEKFKIFNNPTLKNSNSHSCIFTKNLFIERSDFEKKQKQGFYRLYPGSIVRLKSAYCIKCTNYDEDENGNVTKVYCDCFFDIKNVKIKSTIHWVSARYFVGVQARVYDKLFLSPNPESEGDFTKQINPHSLKLYDNCKIECYFKKIPKDISFQFMRVGYFILDKNKTFDGRPVLNQTVALK